MATIVSQIIDESETIVSAELGATYQALRYKFEVEKNDERSARLAYGIIPLDAIPTESVLKWYTVDHTFELILTDTLTRAEGDAERQTALDTMYDKADEIFKDMVDSKLNLASEANFQVLLVSSPSFSEPELVEGTRTKFIVLRMQYTVKYRSQLN